MLERPKALLANQLGAWHSYRQKYNSEPCMIRKGVVFRPSTFLYFWREQNCVFYTETNCLLLCIIWTIVLITILVVIYIWSCWTPDLLLHPNYIKIMDLSNKLEKERIKKINGNSATYSTTKPYLTWRKTK